MRQISCIVKFSGGSALFLLLMLLEFASASGCIEENCPELLCNDTIIGSDGCCRVCLKDIREVCLVGVDYCKPEFRCVAWGKHKRVLQRGSTGYCLRK